MKKMFTRILAVTLLVLGSLFATSFFSTSVLADELDDTIQTIDPDQSLTPRPITPDNPLTPNPDPNPNPDDTPAIDEDADQEGNDDHSTSNEDQKSICSQQVGALTWVLCTSANVVARATDVIYAIVGDLLEINPATLEEGAPIYLVWQIARNLTNIVFVIFLIIVIYSQLTGLGISNYGVKRILPRLIIAVLLVNLSYIICLIAVDLSNIIGAGLRGFFSAIEQDVMANINYTAEDISLGSILTWLTVGGSAVAGGITLVATNSIGSIFWMALIAVFGAVVAVITGLITIAARQALVALLIMISPLAFVAYLLPNTERWFSKWKDLLLRMLIFYPMFSFLFSASHLAGIAIIASATGESAALWTILGLAVQIFPLFFSWQLLKMSDTILGAISSGLNRALSPVQRSVGAWATSHAQQNRERYLANSGLPGAKLRRYLDYRQKLRTTDTMNSATIRSSIATERAMKTLSSGLGRDANGNDIWKKRANRYTRNAKRSTIESLNAQTAELSHANTISAYKFNTSKIDKKLGAASGQSYLELSVQKYREANEAQSDQTWLLNQYLDANKNRENNPYEYNRLMRNGAGSLGHTGETSIMGQVIVKNSEIEERRRREGRIVFTKFGMGKHKSEFRGAIFDTERISDNGYETDEYGNPIENEQYQLKPGYEHTPWSRFIGVHKETGAEITSTEYNALSGAEREKYNKVNYFDITDDHGKPVQRVYTDDAGYMKELLNDDIAIGDPINQRYQLELGVSNIPHKKDGILRSYASTISAAFGATGYKEHDASVTAQLTSQLRSGYVNTIGQLYIAKLQSINNATKPGAFLTNDAFFQKQLNQLLLASQDDELFNKLISAQDLEYYTNVNNQKLNGVTWAKNDKGVFGWQKVPREQATIEQRRDYIKHILIPEVAKKTFGMMNRKPSNNIADSQKPDAVAELHNLLTTIIQLQTSNLDTSIDAQLRLNPDINLYDGGDPNSVKRRIEQLGLVPTKDGYDDDDDDDYGPGGDPPSGDGGDSSGGSSPRKPRDNGGSGGSSSGRYGTFGKQIKRSKQRQERQRSERDPLVLETQVDDIFDYSAGSFGQIARDLSDLFENNNALRKHSSDLASITGEHYNRLKSPYDLNDPENKDVMRQFRHAVKALIRHCLFGGP